MLMQGKLQEPQNRHTSRTITKRFRNALIPLLSPAYFGEGGKQTWNRTQHLLEKSSKINVLPDQRTPCPQGLMINDRQNQTKQLN